MFLRKCNKNEIRYEYFSRPHYLNRLHDLSFRSPPLWHAQVQGGGRGICSIEIFDRKKERLKFWVHF